MLKKCLEIFPDNHYGIFEKTLCPQVNEILQVPGFATGADAFPVYCFIAFCCCCCFVLMEEAGFPYVSLYHLTSSSREDKEEELSKSSPSGPRRVLILLNQNAWPSASQKHSGGKTPGEEL